MDHAVLETDRHRYVVVSYLAAGGMGAIYRGRRVDAADVGTSSPSQEVVLKQLLPEHTADPKRIEMFLREARLTASLSHKNIVRTLDLVNAGDDYYIVMEFVRGGDLRSLLRRAKRRQQSLSLDSVLFIVAEVLAALEYAHTKRSPDGKPLGLIHRDVSPSNVLIDASGQVKLTDFGIAKAPTQGSVVFKVKGKVGYMAPEQARGEPVDARADLFAAGVLLYELLVGERLFVGNALSPAAVIFAQPIVAPSRRRGDVGAELDAIVLRALALDRAGRFTSATEMRRAVLDFARRRGRTLSEERLAADLRQVCGNDPSSWLNLDVPSSATLDGGTREGTGVIAMDDELDEFDRSSGTRPADLPSRELTSVVRLRSANDLNQATQIAPDPFGPSGQTEQYDGATDAEFDVSDSQRAIDVLLDEPHAPLRDDPPPDEFGSEDSRVRTRVQHSDPPRRTERLDSRVSRATFEAPVPRRSPAPPGEDSLPADEATRVDKGMGPPAPPPEIRSAPARAPEPPLLPLSPPMQLDDGDDAETRVHKSNPIDTRVPPKTTYGPASLAALDRSLSRRSPSRIVLSIVGLIVLLALGIGLGVLLSGPSPSEDITPEAPAPTRKTPVAK